MINIELLTKLTYLTKVNLFDLKMRDFDLVNCRLEIAYYSQLLMSAIPYNTFL